MTIDTQSLRDLSPAEKRQLLAAMAAKRKLSAERSYPMSFSQQRLWFLNQLNPGNPFYNVESASPFAGPVDVQALKDAINAIVRRHAVLRTTFREINDEPRQVVAPELTIDLPVIDLSQLLPSERESEEQRILVEESRRPFDLAQGPLIRTVLVKRGYNDHLFLLRMHHIIADGWSMGIFARELEALYVSNVTRQPARLTELPVQYGDFAVWQREWMTGSIRDQQLAYWREQLRDLPTLQLTTNRPRPQVQSHRGAFHNLQIDGRLAMQLKALSRQEDCTLFMTLLAAFVVLLHRWSGQNDIVIGTYIANRRRAEIENLIGFFLNTLVLRTRLEGDQSFRSLMRNVREMSLGAYAHQDLPFEFLVDELQPHRDLSRNPLFQVTFQLNNSPTQSPTEDASQILDFKRGTAIFDLAFLLFETKQGLAGQFEYSTDLFDAETINRMAEQYNMLLSSIVCDPNQAVDRLQLLDARSQQEVLQLGRGPARQHPWEVSLAELLQRQVSERPHEVAFVCEGKSLTFDALNRRASQLAHHLRELGSRREGVVGLCLDRSLDLIVAWWGVVKAGGAWLPLDPTHPSERLAFMLRDAHVKVVVAAGSTIDDLPLDGVRVVRLDRDEQRIASQPETDPQVFPAPDDLAYVIYTSGSTGQPKGVAASHRQILNRLHWMWNEYPFCDGECGAFKTAPSFVDSLWEMFGPLLQGVPSVVLSPAAVRDPHKLVDTLARHHVSRLWLVPSLLQVLLDTFPDLGQRLPDLKFWVASGEILPLMLLNRFTAALPDASLYNLYGTSEIWDATWCDPHKAGTFQGQVPIGRPIDNVQVYVCDANRQPSPLGVPGELFVTGCGLARGYINRPDLTEQSFVELSGLGKPPLRAYRTGDRVLLRPDGHLEFLGRIDQQVKIRGFRVEPSEPEAALATHPEIQMAAVTTREYGSETQLLGWYVPVKGALQERDLREYLRQQLPEYLVPSRFVPLEKMPLTASGKLDRTALREPALLSSKSNQDYEAPEGVVEECLAILWAGLLGVPRVGRNDGFFADLGGHSLLATQLISRLRDLFRLELPLRYVFEYPTIRLLGGQIRRSFPGALSIEQVATVLLEISNYSDERVARMLSGQEPGIGAEQRLADEPSRGFDFSPARRKLLAQRLEEYSNGQWATLPRIDGDVSSAPLSFAQQRLWFHSKLTPGGAPVTIETAAPISGNLHVPSLSKAINQIVKRHDVLRTTIHESQGVPIQVVSPELTIHLPVVDLSSLPASAREPRMEQVIEQKRAEPMDLARGPLISTTLFKLAEDSHVLLTRVNHIIADGWSMGVFARELITLYRELAADREPTLPELPLQYAAFAAWQREHLTGELLEEHLSYWQRQLEGAVTLQLPTDRPRPPVPSFRGAHFVTAFPKRLADLLDAMCCQKNCTLFMALLATFKLQLHAYCKQDDIVVGTHLASRDRQELEGLIGFFLNNLVLRTSLSGADTFVDVLARVRDVTIDAYSHQAVPFEVLVERLSPPRDLSRNPLFQVAFQLNNAPGQQGGTDDAMASLGVNRGASVFDLSLLVVQSSQGLVFLFEYSTDLFDSTTIERMATDYRQLLESIVADPQSSIADLCDSLAAHGTVSACAGGVVTEDKLGGAIKTGKAAPQIREATLDICRELLGRKEIDLEDSFFDVGGHSLVAVQLVARLRAKFNVEVPLPAVFNHPVLAELADFVAAAVKSRGPAPQQRRIPRLPRERYRLQLDRSGPEGPAVPA